MAVASSQAIDAVVLLKASSAAALPVTVALFTDFTVKWFARQASMSARVYVGQYCSRGICAVLTTDFIMS